MGGMSQFLEASFSRKHKRHIDGPEAPRNSLEFPKEASQHHNDENIPYSCQVKHFSMKKNIYPIETPRKTMIVEEQSNRSNNRHSAPSVVARLMGMDTLASEDKPFIPRLDPNEISSDHHMSLGSTPFKQGKQVLLPYSNKRESSYHTRNLRETKPKPREHPQEELLQKFKKEFEAWQASKVWEDSKTLNLDSKIPQVKHNKILAQENLNKEKLAVYAGTKINSAHHSQPSYHISTTKPEVYTWQGCRLQNEGYIRKHGQIISKDDKALRYRAKNNDVEHLPDVKLDKIQDRSSSSARIVILKPSSEGNNDKLKNEGSMEDFLEEVKGRLKYEIHGKATVSGIGTETYFTERSTDPKQIVRHIAKQIKESVTRDLGTTLARSESTRSYRSELQFDGSDSPEFVSRLTRKYSSERMKNALKNETRVEIPFINDSTSRASLFAKEGRRLRSMCDFSEMEKNVRHGEDKKPVTEAKSRHFRCNQQRSVSFDAEAASPRNLIRSFSAPVSRAASGMSLLNDQHISIGAHISRKYEASEASGHASEEVRKSRKDGFNLKQRVSSLRNNFSLKGKFFRKKNQLVHESAAIGFDCLKDIVTTPSVLMNFGTAQENSTEVPPSPASVSSSSYDDFVRPGHPSPDSPLEVPFIEDHPSLQVSGELKSNFTELKSPPEQVANSGSGVTIDEPCKDETIVVDDHSEAYEGQAFHQAFSKLDTVTRPISKWVFEKLKEAFSLNGNAGEEGSSQYCCGTGLSGKLLFDLMSEALPRVLRSPMACSTFKKWALRLDTRTHGGQLLSDLMNQIRIYTDPEVDESHSLDRNMAWDMKMNPWPSISHEDIEVIGKGIERGILRALIDELVSDMSL